MTIKRTAFPAWYMESEPTSSPPSRKQRGRNAPQRNQNRQKMPQWGLPAEKSFRIVRKRRKGASFQAPHDEQSDTATAKPQVANIFNAEFPISSEQHACNEAPLWHFLAETTQQDATQGLNGEVDNPFTKPRTARASFHPPDRNQSRPAHQIASGTSYVSAHPSPKHLDRKAAPAQPAFRTPGISHIAHQTASGTPTPRPPSR